MRSFINQKEQEFYTGFVKFTFHNSKLVKVEETSTCEVDLLRIRTLAEKQSIFEIPEQKKYYGTIVLEFCCGHIISYYFSQKTILQSQAFQSNANDNEGAENAAL